MTIRITVECDSLECCNSKEITNDTDADVLHAGYHSDPRTENYHYCAGCWPAVMAEFESDQQDGRG